MGYVVEIKNLTKRFGKLVAVDNVSFGIKEGEIFGILGPNGAGKTTILNVLFDLLTPTSGRILVKGIDANKNPHDIQHLLGLMTQETIVEADLTARENLKLFCKLYEIPGEEIEGKINRALEDADLVKFQDVRAGTFSGGMQRRLGLVRSMLQEPKILVLDEPTTGLDIQNRTTMYKRIRELNKKGATIILTTQYLEEADQLCDRLAIIDHGKIIAVGTPLDIKERTSGESVLEIVVKADQVQKAAALLKRRFHISAIVNENRIMAMLNRKEALQFTKISQMLDKERVTTSSRTIHPPTLDDVFMKLTGSRIRNKTGEMRGGQASVRWK